MGIFGLGFTKDLKNTISTQENSIRILKEKLSFEQKKSYDESLKVVRLATENATLKQGIINLEGLLVQTASSTMKEEERVPTTPGWENFESPKQTVHPNLLAYYNRGKKKTK